MLVTVISFLPFSACLFWLALNPLIRKNDRESRALELLLAIIGIISAAQAGIPCSDGITALSFFLIKQFFSPLIIPAALYFISSQYKGTRPVSIQVWITIPVALLFAETILIMLFGADTFTDVINNAPIHHDNGRIADIIRFCSFWIFYITLAAQILLWFSIFAVRTANQGMNLQALNCSLVILAMAVWEISVIFDIKEAWVTAIISIALSVLIFHTAYKSLFGSRNVSESETTVIGKSRETEPQPRESGQIIAHAHQSQADEEDLRIRFEDLIVTEQLFLKQGIRISDIASMLETNRTYVSRLVNNTYNMSFSDYINTLRIDYAEQYLMHHRDAKQSDIASACGFPNASAFNNVFKKITGVTPKVWLATRS